MENSIVISFAGSFMLIDEPEIYKEAAAYYRVRYEDDLSDIMARYPDHKKIATVTYMIVPEGTAADTVEYMAKNVPANHPIDLSAFDMVIVAYYEITQQRIDPHLEFIRKYYNNPNCYMLISDVIDSRDWDHPAVYRYPDTMINMWLEEYRDTSRLEKPKLFDALLGLNKTHRKFIFQKLIKHDLLDKSYVSLTSHVNETKTGKKHTLYYSTGLKELENEDVRKSLEKNNDVYIGFDVVPTQDDAPRSLHHMMSWGVYENSWYSIVVETNENIRYLTEKTARPLLAKRIFVIVGSTKMIQRLHEYGFKTFDSIIDESYDLEEDNQTRWTMAFDQVIALSKMDPVETYKKVQDILDHNNRIACDPDYWNKPLRAWISARL